jgi:hypothetical protein
MLDGELTTLEDCYFTKKFLDTISDLAEIQYLLVEQLAAAPNLTLEARSMWASPVGLTGKFHVKTPCKYYKYEYTFIDNVISYSFDIKRVDKDEAVEVYSLHFHEFDEFRQKLPELLETLQNDISLILN